MRRPSPTLPKVPGEGPRGEAVGPHGWTSLLPRSQVLPVQSPRVPGEAEETGLLPLLGSLESHLEITM